jgi:hypothetical protein
MLYRNLLILLSVFLPAFVHSQSKFDDINFEKVDSFSRTLKYEKDLIKLTNELTAPYSEDILKVRSIFIWITNNIRYDYKFINKGKEVTPPNCEDKIDCEKEIREWENAYIKKVLKKKWTICDGYSRLFKRMCDLANIECEIITGYVKQEPYQIGIPLSVNHAWNAIKIDSSYYFVDATWAGGFCVKDEETGLFTEFVRHYNNYYWLTPFDKLVRNHYPQNGKWIATTNYPKEKFFNNPYYAGNILPDIDLVTPSSGIINTKKGDTIHFKFRYYNEIEKIQINSNAFRNPELVTKIKLSRKRYKLERDTLNEKRQIYIPFKRLNDFYEFEYIVKDSSLYYLEVLFDYQKALRFKVTVI